MAFGIALRWHVDLTSSVFHSLRDLTPFRSFYLTIKTPNSIEPMMNPPTVAQSRIPVTGAHVLISGKVQGVGYRASTCDAATLLKIKGWVRNLRNGKVEGVFEGSKANVAEMIRWCHQGPPTADVKRVKVTYQDAQGFTKFEMLRTP